MIKKVIISLIFGLNVFITFAGNLTLKKYIITDYGAIADGQTVNTEAIQKVIDKCYAEGGGVIIIPKGTFLTGAIFLKQGVNLYLEKDAHLKGTTSQTDYPQVQTRWEGIECKWTSALINAVDLSGVEITGNGTIDGSGTEWPKPLRRDRQQWEQLPQSTRDSIIKTPKIGRPRLICFQNCTNVHIANVKLVNQAVWCLHVLYCKNIKIENLDIRADHSILSSDGMDIDSSTDALITGCSIDVNDDCISIKSGKDEDGLRVNKPSENIVIEKCHFGYGHGGVAIGSETSGGIRKVEIRNCLADSGNWAPVRFKTQPSRGNVVEDITYRDIQIKNVFQAFEFTMEWRMVPPIAPPAKVLPIIRNIKIINVTGIAHSVGYISGLKDSPITNVQFTGCDITAQKGLMTNHIKNINFSGLKLNVSEGASIFQKETSQTIETK